MKKFFLIQTLFLFLIINKAHSMSLNEAIIIFYKKNNQIKSEKTKIKEAKASAAATLFSILPDINYNRTISQETHYKFIHGPSLDLDKGERSTFSATDTISLGGTFVAPKKSATLLKAQKLSFRINEQNLLLDAINTYLSVIRDGEILKAANDNVEILKKYLELVKHRFEFGEVTKTDIEQSKARLSDAESTRIQADGNLKVAKANFVKVFGVEPKNLSFPSYDNFPKIPRNFEELDKLAKTNNLHLKYSEINKKLSRQDLLMSLNGVMPSLSFSRVTIKDDDFLLQEGIREQESQEISVTIPLLPRGGAEYGRVMQSKYAVNRAFYDYANTKSDVNSKIIATWQELQTTNANIKSARDTVTFTKSALESIKREAQFGSRTTLDVLDAELEYFNANINLIKMQHLDLLSYYKILAIIGSLDINIFNKNKT